MWSLLDEGVNPINTKFFNLTIDKQERIINAAMQEFVKAGFEKASTNEIVKEAQISKGSLFNYFRNKKDLYIFLIENAVKILEQIYDQIDFNERDLFERLSQVGFIKLNIQKKYPLVFDFLKSIRTEEAVEVKGEIDQLIGNLLDDGLKRLYQNLDWSKFREDVDPEKAIQILNWTMVGFAEHQISKLGTFKNVESVGSDVINEWKRYADILKRSFYREGEE
jgi:TetR/AcrR family transcriptional regulator